MIIDCAVKIVGFVQSLKHSIENIDKCKCRRYNTFDNGMKGSGLGKLCLCIYIYEEGKVLV